MIKLTLAGRFLLHVVFFLVATTACQTGQNPKVEVFPPAELQSFLEGFEKDAAAQNWANIVKAMDYIYCQNQLDNFHNGNREKFLSEFFAGRGGDGHFYVPKLDAVKGLKRTSLKKVDGKKHQLVVGYQVLLANGQALSTEWTIKKVLVGGKLRYGLEGASG